MHTQSLKWTQVSSHTVLKMAAGLTSFPGLGTSSTADCFTGAMLKDVAIHAGKLCSTCLLRKPPSARLCMGLPKLGPRLHSALSLRLWRHSL